MSSFKPNDNLTSVYPEWEECLSSFKQQWPSCSRHTVLLRTRKPVRTICTNMHKQCQDAYAYLNASVILSSSHNKHPYFTLWDKQSLLYSRSFQVSWGQFGIQRIKKTKETFSLSEQHTSCSKNQNMQILDIKMFYPAISQILF